jgi:hypothetical protein
MLTAFNKHKNQSPENFIRSVIGYIEFYLDTSKKKLDRVAAIGHGADLLEFFIGEMQISNGVAYDLIRVALQKILLKMKKAESGMELETFHDELGFLRVLINT